MRGGLSKRSIPRLTLNLFFIHENIPKGNYAWPKFTLSYYNRSKVKASANRHS